MSVAMQDKSVINNNNRCEECRKCGNIRAKFLWNVQLALKTIL